MAEQNYREIFERAVEQGEFHRFAAEYHGFLSHFGSFRESVSATPTNVPVLSAIFGDTCFHLKQTDNIHGQQLLQNSHAASAVFGDLDLTDRLAFLEVLRKKIAAHKEEIELVISADTGKPVNLSAGEMKKGEQWFDYALQQAQAQIGERHDDKVQISFDPLGAVQVIGAYNYPYALSIGGIVGGLAAGNGVIVSAPLKAPNWIFPFMEAANEAVEEFSAQAEAQGKPWAKDFARVKDSLIQYSVGVNPELTAKADMVHFVGSDTTGEIIARSRGLKPTLLEMGGSNVVAVMKSALDFMTTEEIASTIYNGFGPATGQRCTAPRLLCVEGDSGADDVIAKIGDMCEHGDHMIGNPFSQETKMGPLVDGGAHQAMGAAIQLANRLGAKVYGSVSVPTEGMPKAAMQNSFWVGPVMIDWRGADLSAPGALEDYRTRLGEEIFGPLLHVVEDVGGVEEAIETCKRLDSHNLAGAIFANADEAQAYKKGVKVTSLAINGAPRDQSPRGPHGHPGLAQIGGSAHFTHYAAERVTLDL